MANVTNPTNETVREYVDASGHFCPFCHAKNPDIGDRSHDGDSIWYSVSCPVCGQHWEDEYRLVGFTSGNAPYYPFGDSKPTDG